MPLALAKIKEFAIQIRANAPLRILNAAAPPLTPCNTFF
jgi:hypothetical protein